MKSQYQIIIRPHITEKTIALSYGDARLSDDSKVRKYTFIVEENANKIEIKKAIEAIYNEEMLKDKNKIKVTAVNTMIVRGKMRRNFKRPGRKSDFKKAIITLSAGQILEDYGV